MNTETTFRFLNGDLNFEIEKILNYDAVITVSMEYDSNLDYPYTIDVEDNSYFYATENERNSDYLNLYNLLSSKPNFTFHNRKINGFRIFTVEQFNAVYEMDIQTSEHCEDIGKKIDNSEYTSFYISNNDEDVLNAISEESYVADSLDLELVCILPQCVFVALY